jgi:hypothetical protein
MRRDDYLKGQDAARRGLNPADRRAYEVLGLDFDADRRALRGAIPNWCGAITPIAMAATVRTRRASPK